MLQIFLTTKIFITRYHELVVLHMNSKHFQQLQYLWQPILYCLKKRPETSWMVTWDCHRGDDEECYLLVCHTIPTDKLLPIFFRFHETPYHNSEVCHHRCAFKLYGTVNSVKKHNYILWLNDGV